MLNHSAVRLAQRLLDEADHFRVSSRQSESGTWLIDLGIEAEGGLQAGLLLARICLADRATVGLENGDLNASRWPMVSVHTDQPVAACLGSQYAGWQLTADSFFGMGSGPMRAAGSQEELLSKLSIRESPDRVVGVIETSQTPPDTLCCQIAERCGVAADQLVLCLAPTASQAGNVQVVARSIETALHKLDELGFDVRRVVSGWGTAPLPPVAGDDLTGIGRTNDSILYASEVHLWCRGSDEDLFEVGPRIPSCSSKAFGQSFLELFEAANHDFYALDPHLFSPAVVVLHHLDSGRIRRYGQHDTALTVRSFGLDSDGDS